MDPFFQHHFERIKTQALPGHAVTTRAQYILKNMPLKGNPFSFKDHEYQLTILEDPARIKYIRKCSQVGVSEISVRDVLAFCQLYAGVTALYALPTATFAATFSSTRLASAIDSSPIVSANLYKTDSATVKRFLNESFLYMRGASHSGLAISIPVDYLIIDEEDFAESQDILTSFTSRLTHSSHKLETHFSTPTRPNYGISFGYDNSLQHVQLQKCCYCNTWFEPDYFKHVVIPGFNVSTNTRTKTPDRGRPLAEINFFTKALLTSPGIHAAEAYLECPNPKCNKPVDQAIKYRKFVQVNPSTDAPGKAPDEHGYQITPFCAPKHVPPAELVRLSTRYKSHVDFVNNALGLPFEDASTGLTEEEVQALFIQPQYQSTPAALNAPTYPDKDSAPFQVHGLDFGGSCASLTGYPAPNGHLRILTAQMIPLHKVKHVLPQLYRDNRVISAVCDAFPYTDTVRELQSIHPTLWAGVTQRSAAAKTSMELYVHREQEHDETKATYGLRQLTFKKDAMMDTVVTMIRNGQISFAPSTFAEMATISAHLRDPKRVKVVSSGNGNSRGAGGDEEEGFVWRKSATGQDHYFHALVFLVLANFVKGLSGCTSPLPGLITKVKIRGEV